MRIGLYFGSFNPIHTGHLIIASHVLNETSVEKIWFIVSPQNPLKTAAGLLNEYDRLHLVRAAIEDDNRMKASDIEFSLPRPSYTVDTLTYLAEKYPDHEFSIIMGGDSFQNLNKWKNFQVILRDHKIIVYNRPGFEVLVPEKANVSILNAPLLELSSTRIRQLIKEGKSIRYMVTDKVLEEIERSGHYKK